MTGGTAACVVAGRLAAADANLRVLLLEAGPTTYNGPTHTQPLRFLSHLAPGSRTTRVHVSQPSAALGDRTTIVHCGQCLGGGGSINCTFCVSSYLCTFRRLIDLDPPGACELLYLNMVVMMYTRPSASDYDDWETVYQNPGWGSKDLIPLLRKVRKRGRELVLGIQLRGL